MSEITPEITSEVTPSPKEAFAGLIRSVGNRIEEWSQEEATIDGRTFTHKEARNLIAFEAAFGAGTIAVLGPNPTMTGGEIKDLLGRVTDEKALWLINTSKDLSSTIAVHDPELEVHMLKNYPSLFFDKIPNLRAAIDSITRQIYSVPTSLNPEGVELLSRIDKVLHKSELAKIHGLVIEGLAATSMVVSNVIGEFTKTNDQKVKNSSIGPFVGRMMKNLADIIDGTQNLHPEPTQ